MFTYIKKHLNVFMTCFDFYLDIFKGYYNGTDTAKHVPKTLFESTQPIQYLSYMK